MPAVIISCLQTEKALKQLNMNKGAGPDGIHPKMLRLLAEYIAAPLTQLFNLTLSTGIIPDEWRSAIVCPISKKGDKTDPANYRPISMTSAVCKIMERMVKRAMFSHLSNIDAIAANQHGFVPFRS